MTNVEIKEKMTRVIEHAKADENLCAVAYQVLKAMETGRGEMLKYMITGFKSTPTDGTMKLPITVSKSEKESLMKRYGKYVDQKLEELLKKNLSEDDFYEQLADFIVNDDMLQDTKVGAIAIYDCAVDKRLPYHQIDVSKALHMEQDEYIELIKKIGDDNLDKVDSALTYDFDQKTERAAVVLDLIESRESFEERVVMMARVLAHFERDIMKLHLGALEGLGGGLLSQLLED